RGEETDFTTLDKRPSDPLSFLYLALVLGALVGALVGAFSGPASAGVRQGALGAPFWAFTATLVRAALFLGGALKVWLFRAGSRRQNEDAGATLVFGLLVGGLSGAPPGAAAALVGVCLDTLSDGALDGSLYWVIAGPVVCGCAAVLVWLA